MCCYFWVQFWQSKHPKTSYPTEFSGKRNLRFVKCKDFLKFLLQLGATNHVHLIWNQGTSLFCSLTVTEQMTVCFQDCWSISEHKCTRSWLHEHSRVKKQRKNIVLQSPPKSFVCFPALRYKHIACSKHMNVSFSAQEKRFFFMCQAVFTLFCFSLNTKMAMIAPPAASFCRICLHFLQKQQSFWFLSLELQNEQISRTKFINERKMMGYETCTQGGGHWVLPIRL